MAFQDMFKRKDTEEKRPVNPTTLFGIRALAVGYALYCLWQIIKMYIDGGEEAPSVWMLLLAIAVLGGGAVAIAVLTLLKLKQLREEERARLDAEDAAMAQAAEEEEEEPVSV